MGIARFSPQFGRSSAMHVLLTPIQALTALFMPAPPALVPTRPDAGRVSAFRAASVAYKTRHSAGTNSARPAAAAAPVQRLKIVRQLDPGASRLCAGRLFISGRMADVCAELERMAD